MARRYSSRTGIRTGSGSKKGTRRLRPMGEIRRRSDDVIGNRNILEILKTTIEGKKFMRQGGWLDKYENRSRAYDAATNSFHESYRTPVCEPHGDDQICTVTGRKDGHKHRFIIGVPKSTKGGKDVVIEGGHFMEQEQTWRGKGRQKRREDVRPGDVKQKFNKFATTAACFKCGGDTRTGNVGRSKTSIMSNGFGPFDGPVAYKVCEHCEKDEYIVTSKNNDDIWNWTDKLMKVGYKLEMVTGHRINYTSKTGDQIGGAIFQEEGGLKNVLDIIDISGRKKTEMLQSELTQAVNRKAGVQVCEICHKIEDWNFRFGRGKAFRNICQKCAFDPAKARAKYARPGE